MNLASINLHAPNLVLFVIAFVLAMIGVLAALPIGLPVPGLFADNAALYVFLGWFLLAVATALPQTSDKSDQHSAQ